MMGLLGDIYSKANSAKRNAKGLLSDPSGQLEQTIGQMQDNVNVTDLMMKNRLGMNDAGYQNILGQLFAKPADMSNDDYLMWLNRYAPLMFNGVNQGK